MRWSPLNFGSISALVRGDSPLPTYDLYYFCKISTKNSSKQCKYTHGSIRNKKPNIFISIELRDTFSTLQLAITMTLNPNRTSIRC